MNFENTVWLYLTPAIVLIAGGMIAFGLRRRESLLSKFAATRLLDQLTEKASHTRTLIKAMCILIALTALGIALARPQYGIEFSERKARGLDIVFVMDSSKSMLATDIRPTRLDRAKLAVIDLIERLESDRIGLVAFAGRAFLQAPPTLDYAAFRESLDAVGPETMTSGGSDIGNAIKEAEKAFPKDNNFKIIILLTDGEDLGGSAIATATAAAKNGIKIYSIGIGTPEGEYLRIRNGQGKEEFIRDDQGQPVRSQLDEATLQQIAQLTGGTYSRLSAQSLESLYASVISTLPREERSAELQEKPIERFQWAIATAIIFLVMEVLIRRRSSAHIQTAIILATALALSPQATEAQDLPLPESIESEAVEEVAPLPEDPRIAYNQAYDALTSGDIETATTLYNQSIQHTEDLKLQRDGIYNLAHSTYQAARQTYQAGDLENAIEQIKASEALFNSVQEIDPTDSAADEDLQKVKTVREAMEAIQQQQEQNQDQENQDQENQDQEEQEDQESEDGQDQEGEDQESGEQQEQESDEQEQENQDQQQDGEQSDSENQEGSESEQDGDSQQSDQSESEQSEQQESSGDPAEDMEEQEQEAQQGQEQEDEAPEEQEGETPQPTEGEESDEENGDQAGASMVPIEGMTAEDATALLESLRGGEKLLPFVEQGTPQKRGPVKDW